MRSVRFARQLSLLMVSAAVLWATALAAQEAKTKSDPVAPVPRPDQKGWMERHEAMNARVKQGNVDLIFIGDSITQGWEGKGKEVWQKFYGKRNAVNLGISGDQTQHVLWRLDHGNIDGISPKLAVVMIGTNNSSRSEPAKIPDGIKAIVEKLRTKLPETKVLLLGIFPRGENNEDPLRRVNTQVNKAIADLADNLMVFYRDIGPMFLAADGTLSREIMPDLLHPNAKGYEIWAESIESLVTQFMGEKEDPTRPLPLDAGDWLKRHEAINARVKQGGVDLIFIGDSITEGWENEGKDVWAAFYGDRNAVNMGVAGDRTQHVLWRLDHGNVDGIAPKLAVVMIGTNNSSRSEPAKIPDGIKAVVEKLRTKLPETKILLMGILPRGVDDTSHLRQINKKVNDSIAKLADDKTVYYVDIGERFVSGDARTLDRGLVTDWLHPTANGYHIWAETIEPMVAKLMGVRERTAVPVPRDMAWVKRCEALSNRPHEGGVGMIFVGDSITEGWAKEGKDVWQAYYGRRGAVNLGIGGDKTQHVLWRLEHGNLNGIAPPLSVLMVGTNNIGPNEAADSSRDTPEQIAAGIKAIVEKLRAKLPMSRILVLGILPRGATPDSDLRQITVKTNALLAKLADNQNVFYLDIGPKFLTEDGTLTKEVMPDLVHLTPKSYDIWAEAIEPTVSRFMGSK